MAFPKPFFRWRPHPWHGLEVGPNPPHLVHAFIEISPFDLVKYEVDKVSGYLRVDRPQRSSAQHPTLYGFIPRTYCGERVAARDAERQQHARGGLQRGRGTGQSFTSCSVAGWSPHQSSGCPSRGAAAVGT